MPLTITRDPEEFADRAGEFINTALERNVLATVLFNVQNRGGYGGDAPIFAYEHPDETTEPTAVAMRTPPWPMLAVGFDRQAAADELIAQWLPQDPQLPGISAEPAAAAAIAKAWREQTGGDTELEFAEAMHALTEVIPPTRIPPGGLRPATPDDRDLLIDWERAFVLEAGLGDLDHADQMVDRRLEDGLQVVWESAEPVCTVGFTVKINGTVRIGPVYTPPAHRNRGYATAAVAQTSRQLLDAGAARCMLFTDLANPVSNRIYANIGYVRFADWEQHRFQLPELAN